MSGRPRSGLSATFQPPHVPADLANPGAALTVWSALAPLANQPAPVVRACMIASPDGSATLDGLSGGLGTPMDNSVYHTMRMRSELIVASMSTVCAEKYGPATVFAPLAHLRNAPPSTIWAISRTLRAEDIEYVAAAQRKHVTDTTESGAASGSMVIVVAESGAEPRLLSEAHSLQVPVRVIPTADEDFLSGVVAAARREATREILVEPGPRLLAGLLEADLLDELVLSISPQLHLPAGSRLLPEQWDGAELSRSLHVVSAFSAADGGLYTRWAVLPETSRASNR